jgi:hypothetical protein
MPVGTFTRLCGGRIAGSDVADTIKIEGDDALGRRVIDHLGYTI